MMPAIEFVCEDGVVAQFAPIYIQNEHSFYIEGANLAQKYGFRLEGTSSLLILFLEIEVDLKTSRVIYVSGYHPNHDWKAGRAFPSQMKSGVVKVVADPPLEGGLPFSLTRYDFVETVFDASTGWVRITKDNTLEDDDVWEFCTDTALGLIDGELHSLWIRPKFI